VLYKCYAFCLYDSVILFDHCCSSQNRSFLSKVVIISLTMWFAFCGLIFRIYTCLFSAVNAKREVVPPVVITKPRKRVSSSFLETVPFCRIWGSRSGGYEDYHLLLATCFHAGYLLSLFLRPWRWRRCVPPKCQLTLKGLHGVISQKMVLSNPVFDFKSYTSLSSDHYSSNEFLYKRHHLHTHIPYQSRNP
jgi:hypothetical protein